MATSSSPPKAGCRLAKPCFDMSVVETFKTRTAMETIISVSSS
ncbi:GntP family permease [Thauera sinica]|uniref:GntP family permease n=1 Tax=Thauera sinica TaxID=2665146 RepID=A0ABW1API1_9RHOO|nr:GntP family permease [Thauera sp. K11]